MNRLQALLACLRFLSFSEDHPMRELQYRVSPFAYQAERLETFSSDNAPLAF